MQRDLYCQYESGYGEYAKIKRELFEGKSVRRYFKGNRKMYGEVPEKIGQLKMLAPDGKIRLTDCTNRGRS